MPITESWDERIDSLRKAFIKSGIRPVRSEQLAENIASQIKEQANLGQGVGGYATYYWRTRNLESQWRFLTARESNRTVLKWVAKKYEIKKGLKYRYKNLKEFAIPFVANAFSPLLKKATSRETREAIREAAKKIRKVTSNQMVYTMIQNYSVYGIYALFFQLLKGLFPSIADNSCTVAGIPLGSLGVGSSTSIQEIEITHSNKVIKFRAVGSVFLAHQQTGQRNAVKITGKLVGEQKPLYFFLLWLLTEISQGNVKEIDENKIEHVDNTAAMRGKIGSLGKLERIYDTIVEKPSRQGRRYFPVVTRVAVIPNCYVDTFSFEETVEGGKDVIKYDLLLRTFTKSSKYYQNKTGSPIGSSLTDRAEETMWFGINTIYRTAKYFQEAGSIDDRTWKIQNYYDVNAQDVAASAIISGLGLGSVIFT